MNTIIERLDNTTYNLEELNIFTRDFIVSSPSYSHTTEKVEGMDGEIDLGTTLNPRSIRLILYFDAGTTDEYTDKRNEVFDLFESSEAFYIRDTREMGKRWLVKVDGEYDIDQQLKYGFLEIDLIAFSGRVESVGTSIQAKTFEHLHNLPVTYTDYKDIYATKFKIYNPGQPIDPRNINHYLKITYKGNSENLRIENKTTGDVWQYLGTSNLNDEIVLEGIRSTKNGLSIFRQTNKRLITIAPGWNEFEISGAPDTREYAIQANMPRKKIPAELKKNPLTFEFKFIF